MARTPAEVAPLVEAIDAGRMYEAEAWVAAGKPVQLEGAATSRSVPRSALESAIRTGQRDAALLLLCNGYRTDLDGTSPLTVALQERRRDIVELLLAWGAEPRDVSVRAVFASYDGELIEEFWRRGVDLSRGDALAEVLSSETSNKPLYGFLRRCAGEDERLQMALDRALCTAVDNHKSGRDYAKAVSLCMWAGANPWTPVPEPHDSDFPPENEEAREWRDDANCAVGRAMWCEDAELLRLMKLRPDSPRFQRLYAHMWHADTYLFFAAIEMPRSPEVIATRAMCLIGSEHPSGDTVGTELLERVLESGVRIERIDDHTCKRVQDYLRTVGTYGARELLRLLQDPAHCDETVLLRILQSPKVIAQSHQLGIARSWLERLLDMPTISTSVAAAVRRELPADRRRRRAPIR